MIEYLTIPELAKRLKISQTTLQDMRRNRQLPKPVLVNKSPRWLSHEVDEYLASNRGTY